MRISDWSSDVCSSDLGGTAPAGARLVGGLPGRAPDPWRPRASTRRSPCHVVAGAAERRPPGLRAADAHRTRQHHAPAPAVALDGVAGPAELAALSAPGCNLAQRSPFHRRRRGVEPEAPPGAGNRLLRSDAHTSELQSLMRISYAVV